MIRVADYIAQSLYAAGARTAFMVSGGMMMHLIDAIARVPGVRYYCNHHEQACAMAADAYSRESGRLGLCYATSGPGATNILTGLAGAWQDSIPVMFLTGQNKVCETIRGTKAFGLRQAGFLEVDIIPMVQSVTKYAAFLSDPSETRYHVEKAIFLALSGRPGPVLLDVPLDVQGAQIDPERQKGFEPKSEARQNGMPHFTGAVVEEVVDRIASAARPLFYFGHGVRCAGGQGVAAQLLEALEVPVVTTAMAKDLVPYDAPLFVGNPGIKGDRAANLAVQAADLLICVGTSLKPQNTGYEVADFAPNAIKVHVDPDPHVLEHGARMCQHQIQCDSRLFLEQLLAVARRRHWKTNAWPGWTSRCREWKEQFQSRNEKHDLGDDCAPLNAYEFVFALSAKLPRNCTIVTDAGQPFYFLPQALQHRDGQRYIVPGSFAEMGYALPASIGIATAHPDDDHTTIAVIGDGSLQTNIQELQTIRHHGFNIKIFVIDNGGYASIRSTQNRFFNGHLVGSSEDSGVSLPELSRIAEAYGLTHIRCPDRRALAAAIDDTLATAGPAICSVRCMQDQEVLPAVPSMRLPDGKIKSRPLHEMAPLLTEDDMRVVFPFSIATPEPAVARAAREESSDRLQVVASGPANR
jgi:acetolactate synthase-1/2/3 large subunit